MTEKPKTTPTKEQRRAADPKRSVWVAASAGSGKTQVLVDRVIRLLLQGTDPQSLLCLTFTKAAAAEMANRLFERLSAWVGLSDSDLDDEIQRLSGQSPSLQSRSLARRLFTSTLETPGGLKIQTIHGFCERLLQLFPVESGMAPGFRVLDEAENQQLFRDALLKSLASDAEAWSFLESSGIRSLEDLESVARPFMSGTTGMRQFLSDMSALPEIETRLRQALSLTTEVAASQITSELCAIDATSYHQAIKAFTPYGPYSNFAVYDKMQLVLNATTDTARLKALGDMVLTGSDEPRKKLIGKPATDKNPDAAQWLEHERQRIIEGLESLALQETLDANLSLYRAMARVLARVNIAKRAKGFYDFDDLIAKTAHLLEGHQSALWVLYKLDKGLTHILVDEAQDTSPAQWSIVKALASAFFSEEQRQHPRTIFAVGDIKQSIFSFQGADISSFEAAKTEFKTQLHAINDALDVVNLSISYRSAQVVLNSVDQVFAEGKPPRLGFGPGAADEPLHTAFFKDRLGLVELWDVIRPDPAEETDHWQAPVDRPLTTHHRLKLAERIAKTVETWIGKRTLSGHNRAVAAGDILILFQRRSPLFNAIIGALRRHNVKVAGADRLVLQNSLIVKDLQALGQVLRLPGDDHALACFLKSPLAAQPLDDDDVFTLAHDRGRTSLLQRLKPDDANRLQIEHLLASNDTPFLLFAKLIQQAKQRILERLGPEAEDAAQEFLNLALDYEQKSGTSLTGFLEWLAEGETQIKREMDQNSGEVRIMTVHGAKGLEAPIVILPDCADAPRSPPNKYVAVKTEGATLYIFKTDTRITPAVITQLSAAEAQLRNEENMRLMYVAMTRAADELYICGSYSNDKLSDKSWYFNMEKTLQENQDVRLITTDPDLRKWRLGAEPETWHQAVITPDLKTEIPPWALQPVELRIRSQLLPTASRNSDQFDREAVKRGLAIHRLIEMMADVPKPERQIFGERWAAKLKLPVTLAAHLNHSMQQEDMSDLFGPDGQSEVTVHGKVEGLGQIHGRIDRLVITPGAVTILDYKTNLHPPKTLDANHSYTQQLARYAALLAQAYPGHALKAGLLWTETGQVSWLSAELLSQSLLQQRQAQVLTQAPIITT
jgi:ATP-dependent helicase/nuclease subunit A